MKDLKKKLTAAAAMLVVSAVMLSGVSYAWYTLSTNPEVSNIKATAVANQNLEIALMKATDEASTKVDERSAQSSVNGSGVQGSTTANYYTWGNLVDLTAMIDSAKAELRPAKYVTDTGLQYPTYGNDGRVENFANLTAGTYTTDKEGVAYENNGKQNYALRVDYWLKTNTEGDISLSVATKRDETNDTNEAGGSYIQSEAFKTGGVFASTKEAVKVLFKVKEEGANTNASWVEATNGDIDPTTGKILLTTPSNLISTAKENTAYQVTMYVYLNGNVVTNAMAKTAINDISVNVQFDNDGITTGAMQK